MSFSEHKIFHIDDYILERNKGNEFLSLIEQYFRDEKLTFSLLEMVLLNEKGIGETYIFAKKDFNSHKFYEDYCALIKTFKNNPDFEGGVSAFKEWYTQNTWIFIGQGQSINGIYTVRDFDWLDKFEPKDIKEYGEKVGLTKEFILKYFNAYAKAIAELELNKHPYYFIIIQPIYKNDHRNNNIIPMGNLYLHFATIDKVEIEEIKDFLRGFMMIWFKCYGGIKHSQILKKIVSTVINTSEVKYYTPSNLGSHEELLSVLYYLYFKESDNLEYFRLRTAELKNKLQKLKDSVPASNVIDGLFKEYKKKANFEDLIKSKSFSKTEFELFLLKRALAYTLFVSFKMGLREIHELILAKSPKEGLEYKSILDYFYQNLHIYLSKTKNEDEMRKEICDSISDFEKDLINEFI